MLVFRVLSRVSRSVGLRSSVATPTTNQIPIVSLRFHSIENGTPNKLGSPLTGGKQDLVGEKQDILKVNHQQEDIKEMKDRFLRSYAEMQDLVYKTKREAENTKKFAVESFAKSLLDAVDCLGKASSLAKESFSKIDTSKDSVGAAQLLKSLLEGVEKTEKQLIQAFRKSGLVKEDPLNEPFDPNRHKSVFHVPDASKPQGTIVHVHTSGYSLYDRVIRAAEVGITCAVKNQEDEKEV